MNTDPTTGGDGAQLIVWVDGQAWYGLDGHVLGRDASASITVDNVQVSRRHAALAFDGVGWALHDLGSVNGIHDATGRHEVIALPPGRTQVWFGPPASSPAVYFDVTPSEQPAPHQQAPAPQPDTYQQAPYQQAPAPLPDPYQQAPYQQAPVPQPAPYEPAPFRGGQAASARPEPPAPSPTPSPPPPPPGSMGSPSVPPPPAAGSVGSPSSDPYAANSAANPNAADPYAPTPFGSGPRGVGLNANSALLEQNLGQASQVIRLAGSELVVGRSAECDLSIADPLVSRRHARLVLHHGGGRIIDLGSDNGTFVNGQRITDSPLVEGDLIEMGRSQFVLSGGELRQHIANGLPLQAVNLTVSAGGRILLNDVSFTLPPGSMTAVIGPSGSGKSTLLNALTGRRPADQGRVVLGGRDLYGSDEGLGRRIGFVPQDDPVHPTLNVRHALAAAARLRLPSDVSRAEIAANVEQVAGQLGLGDRLGTRVKALSGGQRKRVSVAYELVGTPQALILDEPTSGLDPGMERDLMTRLRQLADTGTTTVVVTHSVQSVELCDLVIVLAPGGRLAFIGPPSKVARHFSCPDLASVFNLLGTRQRAEWEMEFASTTSYLKFGAPAPIAAPAPSVPLPPRSSGADLRVMLVRYIRSLLGDRRRLVLLLAQAPILGAVLAAILFRDAFVPGSAQATRQYLLATVLVMTWLGGSNSVREIVQEREVFRRERAVGVSAMAFVLSRWIVLGAATSVQAVVLHLVASLRQENRIGPGVILGSGELELILALIGVGLASVGIGLLISALVSDAAKALTLLPLVLIPTLLLSGLVIATSGRPGVEQLTYANPVQWGASAAAVSVDLRAAESCGPELVADQGPVVNETCANGRWERSTTTQAVNFALVALWSVALLVLAGWACRWSISRPVSRG